jgi:RNA polymerase sigma-70 factor (ECF subfamily)
MESDEELYHRVRNGELRAFDELYARYESRLFAFLCASLGNRADAEDTLHEAFLNTLKSREVSLDTGGFRVWLFRIARNAALNRRRSAARGAIAKAALPSEEPPPSAHDRLEAHELATALDAAVLGLPPALADVYRLRSSGLSYEEMADVLEAPVGTIKSRMHEMVKQLKERMRPWTAQK